MHSKSVLTCLLKCFSQVDYHLALEAEQFTGNSVSTFTAFIMLERRWLGRCVVEGNDLSVGAE
jgi:hypothetical protein